MRLSFSRVSPMLSDLTTYYEPEYSVTIRKKGVGYSVLNGRFAWMRLVGSIGAAMDRGLAPA